MPQFKKLNFKRFNVWCSTLFSFFLLIFVSFYLQGRETDMPSPAPIPREEHFELANNCIRCTITLTNGILTRETIEALPSWLPGQDKNRFSIQDDADFGFEIQWTDWQAPGKIQNAENPIILTKANFQLTHITPPVQAEPCQQLQLLFKGIDLPLEARLTYQLDKDAFFIKRRLEIRDPGDHNHFLQWLWPRRSIISGDYTILKPGGFGRPLALLSTHAGAFFGLEYPAAENSLKPLHPGRISISTGQEIGEKITDSWTASEWTVSGLSPDTHVQLWFYKYLDSIRVAPLKPYLLYNTWYDVRAPEYTNRPEDIMNETNLMRIINDFKHEMVDKRQLKLDAFVLDDAWDIYKSDWVLRKNEFPHGLLPIKDALAQMDTQLGIWFGPTGGYSHRDWRISWMKEHGYEVVGDQLCLAGKNYHQLFKNRVLDFVNNHGVRYFKWDGIQFSCSEPDHGHPIGIYSRRAVMQAVADLCHSTRLSQPDMYLNITSGTWLSPWWLKYANMIWMQGYDYGYANVPSISKRDAAITYRDVVLFENYRIHDFWFPLANLMTHGIIKGHLQKLGGDSEPLEKFMDDVILYFARGVTMWELYISPNLLTHGEWDAIAYSIRWARDRFPILKQTNMIGGDPEKREAYGYVHFSGKKGIIAARNPFIQPRVLEVSLDPAFGLCPSASSLVLERVYPNRWISPELVAAGATLQLPLNGYETAIYEIYPLEDANEPLLAGVVFDTIAETGTEYNIRARNIRENVRILNPEQIKNISINNQLTNLYDFHLPSQSFSHPVKPLSVSSKNSSAHVQFQFNGSMVAAWLCFLVEPSFYPEKNENDKATPSRVVDVQFFLDGEKINAQVEEQEGRWAWYRIPINVELINHTFNARMEWKLKEKSSSLPAWKGKISTWVVYDSKPETMDIKFALTTGLKPRRPLPPQPRPAGQDSYSLQLGEIKYNND